MSLKLDVREGTGECMLLMSHWASKDWGFKHTIKSRSRKGKSNNIFAYMKIILNIYYC